MIILDSIRPIHASLVTVDIGFGDEFALAFDVTGEEHYTLVMMTDEQRQKLKAALNRWDEEQVSQAHK